MSERLLRFIRNDNVQWPSKCMVAVIARAFSEAISPLS